MLTTDPTTALLVAREHVRNLRDEAGARHLRPASSLRRCVAAWLRRFADRLERASLAARTA